MPIYEYRCERCGEIIQNIKAMSQRTEVAPCTSCDSMAVRIPSAPFDDGYRFSSHDRAVVGDNWVCPSRREALKNQ